MFGEKKSFPDEGEIVLCTVTKIYHHSVFASIDEYNISGMLHISEISPGRIRNIRDYVIEGKKIVCKVLSTNKEKGHVDLSLRRVTESQKRKKAADIKQEQIAERIIETVAKKNKMEPMALYNKVKGPILESYETIPLCFEDVSMDAVALETLIDKKIAKELTEIIKQRIKPPEVEIGGLISLTSYHPEGVNVIKKVLKPLDAKQMKPVYVGSGKYKVTTKAPDYKTAEKHLKEAVDNVLASMKKFGGEGSFERMEQ